MESKHYEAVRSLKDKKIFFGHASVGYNILDGVEELAAGGEQALGVEVRELKDGFDVAGPAIYHAVNGKNGYPKGKVDAFKERLEKDGFGNKIDIAFFKFCYVDFNRETDVKEVFDYYVNGIDGIKEKFPDLRIIHVTTPLYAHGYRLKSVIKNIIKGDIANVKRNRFNRMLIEKYEGTDPIYDLARVESLYPDGRRSSFKYKGEVVYSLAKEYTNDGGHLNEKGRRLAAKELLRTLSGLSDD